MTRIGVAGKDKDDHIASGQRGRGALTRVEIASFTPFLRYDALPGASVCARAAEQTGCFLYGWDGSRAVPRPRQWAPTATVILNEPAPAWGFVTLWSSCSSPTAVPSSITSLAGGGAGDGCRRDQGRFGGGARSNRFQS